MKERQDPTDSFLTVGAVPSGAPNSTAKSLAPAAARPSYPCRPDPATMNHLAFVLLVFSSEEGFIRTMVGKLVVSPRSEEE